MHWYNTYVCIVPIQIIYIGCITYVYTLTCIKWCCAFLSLYAVKVTFINYCTEFIACYTLKE